MHVNEWTKLIGTWAARKGWNSVEVPPLERHMLMVTEIAEATEEVRKNTQPTYSVDGKPEGEAIELADCIIRIMHYFDVMGWNLEEALEMKMAYNEKRPWRHGNKAH